MKKFYEKKQIQLFYIGILGIIIGIVSFLPILIHHNGQYMEYGDYFLQYVPFIKELKRMILSGNLSWSWNSFLGDSFISAYSYYTIFNPFAWLVMLFPNKYILYGTIICTLLKFALCMIGSSLYMRKFCQNDKFVIVGAMLYTFSGFTIVNTYFYFFLDVIALFPFLMYSLECLLVENKYIKYILFLAINAMINYYFYVSTVILIVIYVFFRMQLYKFISWRQNWKKLLKIILYSVIGTGLSGIALIPSLYAILGSGKAMGNIGAQITLFYYPQVVLEHLRTLVAPIESDSYHVFYDTVSWASTAVYLPIFGLSLVVQYIIEKKDWLKKISVFLLTCYLIPVLNAVFNLFSSFVYTRWLYGVALIYSLITAIQLENIQEDKENFNIKILKIYTFIALLILFVPATIYILYKYGISLINRFASQCAAESFMGYQSLLIMLMLSVINFICLWYCVKSKKKNLTKMVLTCVVFACITNYFVYNTINYDRHKANYSDNKYYQKIFNEGKEVTNNDFIYRIDYPSDILNYGLFKNMPSVNYYNSLQNIHSSKYASAVGFGKDLSETMLESPEEFNEWTDALLSVKYYYDYDGKHRVPNGFTFYKEDQGVKIYKNNRYIPMGFTYKSYCLERKLYAKSKKERAQMMLNALIIKQEDEDIVKEYVKNKTHNIEKNIENVVKNRRKNTADYFRGTSKGFEAKIKLKEKNIVFFSIPNDSGWNIRVNGNKAKIVEVNAGLIGVCCGSGENIISGIYNTKGLTIGIACTIGSLIFLIILEILNQRAMQLLISSHRH